MRILDANIILRYLLNDNEEMVNEAERMVREGFVQVTIEVIAEVVYVLKRVYSVERIEIKTNILKFLEEVQTPEFEILKVGLETFAEQNLDFVDCILYAYNKVKGYEVKTFDKKLNHLLEQNNK